jgi:hypothetical protein
MTDKRTTEDSKQEAQNIWIKWNTPPQKHITFDQANAMVGLISEALLRKDLEISALKKVNP